MLVTSYVDVIHAANQKVKIVDVDTYALMRAVKYILKEEGSYIALLDFSLNVPQCIVMFKTEIIFHQSFMPGMLRKCLPN